jgi:hypothetical protein
MNTIGRQVTSYNLSGKADSRFKGKPDPTSKCFFFATTGDRHTSDQLTSNQLTSN